MAALSTLRTRVREYILETDSSNSHFTDAQINNYLNDAVLFLGTQMEWPIQTSTATAITDQSLYSLPTDFIELIDGYFDNTKVGILSREDLGGVSPSWQQDPSSTPKVFYKADNAVLGLYPPPDSSQNGKVIQIQYVSLPATLSQDTDVPDLHSAFQLCLPFYAAFICDYSLGNEKQADKHLAMYEYHKKQLMARVQKFSDDLLRFRWSSSYPTRS